MNLKPNIQIFLNYYEYNKITETFKALITLKKKPLRKKKGKFYKSIFI